MNLTYRILPNGRVTVKRACVMALCTNVTSSIVAPEQIEKWQAGALVQDAFPEIPENIREALFVSGFCSPCWDALFPEEECGFCQQTDCEGDCEPHDDGYDPSWDYPVDANYDAYVSMGRPLFPNEY